MKRLSVTVALALLASVAVLAPTGAAERPPKAKQSPPGQISIVTLNAHQFPILGIRRFRAMFQLSRALRRRPAAFDGGFFGAVHAPDVIVLQEIRDSNAEIFEHILRQRFGVKYSIVTPAGMAVKILAHPDLQLVGDVVPLNDACSTPTDDRYPARRYPVARFIENDSETTFAVVGVHFPKGTPSTADCLHRNVEQLRLLFEAEQTPTVIAGDFNRRPVEQPFECDPDERSAPTVWWSALTAPDNGGRQYIDAVRHFNRAHSIRMQYEWTHEHKKRDVACTGNVHHERARIDYIFTADATVAEAHTDHPGWGGLAPGDRHPHNFKYSDHRWVWARIILSGPPSPGRPTAAPEKDGVIDVTWEPVEGVAEWVVYRAIGARDLGVVARLTPETLSYEDTDTDHLRTYKYAIAARGPNGGQGVESGGAIAVADSRGPQVLSVYPAAGAVGVGPGQSISARFDEGVVPDSVDQDSMRLYVDGHTVRGFVVHKFPRQIKFNPMDPLKKGKTYTAVVTYGLRDRLGNVSGRFAWSFRTEEPPPPPPKKKRRRRG